MALLGAGLMVNVFGLVYLWTLNMQASATAEVIFDEFDASRKNWLKSKRSSRKSTTEKLQNKRPKSSESLATLRDRKSWLLRNSARLRSRGESLMALTSESVQARASLAKRPLRSSRTTSPRRVSGTVIASAAHLRNMPTKMALTKWWLMKRL